MKPNVALFGQMYAGKSTIADALTEHGYHRMSFAAPLKNVAALAYGEVKKDSYYEVVNPDFNVVTGRMILQGIGQAVKEFDRHFWLRCFFRDAENYLDTPLVVDDGRFKFEADALRGKGWLIVGIETPLDVRLGRALNITGRYPSDSELTHQSEIEVPDIIKHADIIVDGTADPYANARKILDAYALKRS